MLCYQIFLEKIFQYTDYQIRTSSFREGEAILSLGLVESEGD